MLFPNGGIAGFVIGHQSVPMRQDLIEKRIQGAG